MKKTLNLRKILLIVFGFLFAISAAAFGLSLRAEKSYAETDYSLVENWFNTYEEAVTQTKISDDRFEFSREIDGGVISFKQVAFDYLISQGYDAIRITYVEKTPATGTNLGIYRDGETWQNSVWTNGVEQSRIFDITGGAFSVRCAKANVTEFYFTFTAINAAAIYGDAENWFDAKVPYAKVGDNSFDFTVAGGADTTILKFSAEALDYLAGKGYDKIRMTYYGKNGATINMGLRLSKGSWSGWTDNIKPRSDEFKIDDLKADPAINAFYVAAEGIDGFNVTFKAINTATLYEDVEEWFTAETSYTKVGAGSFDFTKEGDGIVLSFKAEALTYLANKGYDAIRVTYVEKNPVAGTTDLGFYRDGETWRDSVFTGGVAAKSRMFNITGGAFSLYCAKASVVTQFNITFKAINTATLYEDVEEWFKAEVPYTKVGDNSFDFTVAGDVNTTILKFNAEALDYLAGKGYDKICVTYYGKNGAAINMGLRLSRGGWLGWTSNIAPVSNEVEISSLKADPEIIAYYVPQDGTDGFNVTFKAINTANKEVTFNVNGEFNKTVEVEWNEVSLAAAMPQVTEADTVVIGYALNDKLYATASAVFTAASGIEGDLTIDVIALRLETQDGAEIRVSGTAGLRFTSLVGKSAHFSEFGMILTVRSNVDTNSENAKAVGIENFDKESLTAASLKYIDIVSTDSGFNSYEKNGNTVFNLVLTNISEAHLTMQYIARTYVTVNYADGTTVTYYSDVDFENNARAPQDVGYSALDNAELSGITEDQKAFIKENYLSKKA